MFTSISNDMYLAAIGIIWSCTVILYISIKLCRAVRIFLLPRIFPTDLDSNGKWAVVTGGSSGIGKSFAYQLAKRGLNIIIISNEPEPLKLTAEEIEHKHGVQCCYIYADFTKGLEVYDQIVKQIGQKDIGILVNGAGILGKLPRYFLEETDRNILTMINLHITTVVYMTYKVLPSMLAKNKGVIVNISSSSSYKPLAMWNIYSSSKAFTDVFTNALYWEYKSNKCDVRFQSLVPFFIASRMTENMSGLPRFGGIVPDCNAFSVSAVNTIGTTNNTSGYWIHEIMWFLVKLCPHKLVDNYCLKGYINTDIKSD